MTLRPLPSILHLGEKREVFSGCFFFSLNQFSSSILVIYNLGWFHWGSQWSFTVEIHLQALCDLASTSPLVPSSLTPPRPLHPSLTGLLLQSPRVCLSFCSRRIILLILETSAFLDYLHLVLSTQTHSSVVSSHCVHLLYVRVIILHLLVLLISIMPLSFTRLAEGKTCVCFHLQVGLDWGEVTRFICWC